jgi:putative ABC transport system permease protein
LPLFGVRVLQPSPGFKRPIKSSARFAGIKTGKYMFAKHLSAAFRHLGHNKFAASINIISLAVGLAAALLVALFVQHELSYDRWIPDAKRVYRLESELLRPDGGSIHLAVAPAVAAGAMKERFSEIETVTQVATNIHSLHIDDKVHYEWIAFADTSFFDVLDIPLIEGDRATALEGVSSVLLSEDMALKYFGKQSPLGQTLSVEAANGGEVRDFKVSGVFRNIPTNSHLQLNMLFSRQASDDVFDFPGSDSWHDFSVYTYLKLRSGARPEMLEAGFPAMLDSLVDASRWGEGSTGSQFFHPYLVGLTDIHMDTVNLGPMRPLGDWGLVYALIAIALLILAIGSINFMNLALARSMSRAREVSIRKIHGAGRRQLMSQYMVETVIQTLCAVAFALTIVSFVLPYLNSFVEKELALSSLLSISMVVPAIVAVSLIAVLAGFYPALVVSSFRPAVILRGTQGKGGKGHGLRTWLVVFQFTVSIALGIGALVIQSQRQFTASHELGFSTDDKLVIRYMNWGHFAEKSPIINERIKTLPEVVGTAYSGAVPGDVTGGGVTLSVPGSQTDDGIHSFTLNVGDGFFEVYGVELVAGRFFSQDFGEDHADIGLPAEGEIQEFSAILNESAVRALGFESAQDALGVILDVGIEYMQPKVVGVVRDFHFASLREEIIPTTYFMSSEGFGNLTVRFRQDTNVAALVERITAVWQDYIPRDPITLEYLDQNLAVHYAEDRRQGMMVASLAMLALFVACIGLYALSALTAAERSREVSIRKIHGASIPTITLLLLWQFSRPVLLAIGFALPLAWFGARQYLDQFSYRIDLGPLLFIGAGAMALLIAGLTVGAHAFRVARTNPIHALLER